MVIMELFRLEVLTLLRQKEMQKKATKYLLFHLFPLCCLASVFFVFSSFKKSEREKERERERERETEKATPYQRRRRRRVSVKKQNTISHFFGQGRREAGKKRQLVSTANHA